MKVLGDVLMSFCPNSQILLNIIFTKMLAQGKLEQKVFEGLEPANYLFLFKNDSIGLFVCYDGCNFLPNVAACTCLQL